MTKKDSFFPNEAEINAGPLGSMGWNLKTDRFFAILFFGLLAIGSLIAGFVEDSKYFLLSLGLFIIAIFICFEKTLLLKLFRYLKIK